MKTFLASHRRDVLVLMLAACACAIAWPFHQLILLAVGIAYLFRGWLWICRRHPLLGWFILGFVRGLLGSGRRGRRW